MRARRFIFTIIIIVIIASVLFLGLSSKEIRLKVANLFKPTVKLLDIERTSPPPIKGWYDWQGARYYYSEGERQKGWQKIKGSWYYFDNQAMMTRGWLDENGIYYLDPESGKRLEGIQAVHGKYYYLKPVTGKLQTSRWIEVDKESYYLQEDGSFAQGWLDDDGLFYMDPKDGRKLEGLQIIDDKIYYLELGTGRLLVSQWMELEGNHYYLGDDGSFTKGWLKNGDYYYFDLDSGARLEGLQSYEDDLYYLEPGTGKLLTDQWLKLSGEHYYLTNDGRFAKGKASTPDGDYFFDDDGRLLADLSRPLIHISYDDGPSYLSTGLLVFLDKEDVKVSFFYLGMMIPGKEHIVKRAYEAGHSIGSHSYNHPSFPGLSEEEIRWQIDSTDGLIADVIGVKASWFRSPYGETNARILKLIGKPTIHWDIDSEDWKDYSAKMITESILKYARDGGIILFHDTHENSIEASKLLIPLLKKEGYQIVNLETLFKVKGVEPELDQLYFGF